MKLIRRARRHAAALDPRPLAWVVVMARPGQPVVPAGLARNLATDLARYGPTAPWRGVYYRGEKIGFTVSQTVRTDDGFELQEDGAAADDAARRDLRRDDPHDGARRPRLRARSLSSSRSIPAPGRSGARRRELARLDRRAGSASTIAITSGGDAHRGARLAEAAGAGAEPVAAPGRAASRPGRATSGRSSIRRRSRNAPVDLAIGEREVVRTSGRDRSRRSASRWSSGAHTTSWVTDTGEVVREESPLGLMTVRETPERAQGLGRAGPRAGGPARVSAVVPAMRQRIDEPRDVRRLRLRLDGADCRPRSPRRRPDASTVDIVEIRDPQTLQAGPRRSGHRALSCRPSRSSKATRPRSSPRPSVAVSGVTGARARAERLTRYVNALLDKKPTVSLPSAREVLRTKVGDCNEHTALYVAMARVARHSGADRRRPRVYVRQAPSTTTRGPRCTWTRRGRGLWLPVDPTLNQFPADATHLRLARGGLDKQAAILPLIGRLR